MAKASNVWRSRRYHVKLAETRPSSRSEWPPRYFVPASMAIDAAFMRREEQWRRPGVVHALGSHRHGGDRAEEFLPAVREAGGEAAAVAGRDADRTSRWARDKGSAGPSSAISS